MREIGTVRTAGLNLRYEPKLHSKIRDQLQRGDELEIIKHDSPFGEEWLHVKVTKTKTGVGVGGDGWVYSADVDVRLVPPDMPMPEPSPPPPDWGPVRYKPLATVGCIIAALALLYSCVGFQ